MYRSTFSLPQHLLEVSASRPGRFTPGERSSGTYWIGGWVDPRAGLNDIEKRKFLTLPGLELRPLCRPARSQSRIKVVVPKMCATHYFQLVYIYYQIQQSEYKLLQFSSEVKSGSIKSVTTAICTHSRRLLEVVLEELTVSI
jgi:hypothetical protein